jgi:hypothetical protein
MLAQDVYDLTREKGWEGVPMAIPGAFGVGSQTYGEMTPVETKTPMGKPSIRWRQEPSLGEEIYNKVTGTKVTEIPEQEQKRLRKERLEKLKTEVDMNKAKRMVLETGQPQRVGGTYIYLERGVVKTKKLY